MTEQLSIGLSLVAVSVFVEALFIGSVILFYRAFRSWIAGPPIALKTILIAAVAPLWLFIGLCISIWMWAYAFYALGLFETFEPALYFALVCFTTLGFGDILLSEEHRLLSGVCAANGLLLFGLTTAFLIEFFSRLRQADRVG